MAPNDHFNVGAACIIQTEYRISGCQLLKFHYNAVYSWHPKQAVREAATICPRPCDLDLFTLKVVSESRVTWATSVPILVFPWPLCSRFRPDVRDRLTDVRQHHFLMPPPRWRGITILLSVAAAVLFVHQFYRASAS